MLQQQGNGKCWENGSIFQSEKLILQISLSPPSGPPIIDICQCQASFSQTFGLADSLPMSLEDLISTANEAQEVSNLLQAILVGAPHSAFLCLRDANGVDLACYVQVSMGYKADNLVTPSSVDLRGITRSHTAIMTIRSASTIGNVPVINVLVNHSMIGASQDGPDAATQHRVLAAVNGRIDQNIAAAQEAALNTKNKATAKAAPKARSTSKPAAAASSVRSTSSTASTTTHPPMPPLTTSTSNNTRSSTSHPTPPSTNHSPALTSTQDPHKPSPDLPVSVHNTSTTGTTSTIRTSTTTADDTDTTTLSSDDTGLSLQTTASK